eukprot:3774560-Rhodomonas_salina.1
MGHALRSNASADNELDALLAIEIPGADLARLRWSQFVKIVLFVKDFVQLKIAQQISPVCPLGLRTRITVSIADVACMLSGSQDRCAVEACVRALLSALGPRQRHDTMQRTSYPLERDNICRSSGNIASTAPSALTAHHLKLIEGVIEG